MMLAARPFLVSISTIGAVCAFSMLMVSGAKTMKEAVTAADARSIYNRQCVSCHGRDGRGQTRRGRQTRARDMSAPAWQDDVSDERLFNSISNGRGKMPAFRKKISEHDIDALVSLIRRMRR